MPKAVNGLKICSRPDCDLAGKFQPLENFYRRNVKYYRFDCKVCARKHAKIWGKQNREHKKITNEKSHKRDPIRFMYRNLKHSAKQRGIPFTITLQDLREIELPEYCPVFNIKLFWPWDKKAKSNSFSVDRINNDLGYEKGNIVIVSWKANDLKRTSSISDLEKIVNFYKRITNYAPICPSM